MNKSEIESVVEQFQGNVDKTMTPEIVNTYGEAVAGMTELLKENPELTEKEIAYLDDMAVLYRKVAKDLPRVMKSEPFGNLMASLIQMQFNAMQAIEDEE